MSETNKTGIIYACLAYSLWGVLPVYWKLIDNIPPFEILAHRIFWAFIFIGVLLLRNKQWKESLKLVKDKRKILLISLAAVAVTINWGAYIWAVNTKHVVESSLGYYINPLIVVCFGVVFLKEKLTKWQMVALSFAAIGVAILTVQYGKVPWVSLLLAVSFAIYGLLKKLINAGSMTSLIIETAIITPFTLIYIIGRQASGVGALGNITTLQTILLVCSGAVTAVPLLLFAEGARRVPLSTLGFTQYISPTISLIMGIFLFHEKFTTIHFIGFSFIWFSLVIYSISQAKFQGKTVSEIATGKDTK